MKRRTLFAIAVAGAFACSSGAYAASAWNGHEVLTPSSVDADAVELAFVEPDPATGASSDAIGSGTVAFDSSMSESPGAEAVVYTPAAAQIVEMLGEATP